MGKDKETIRVVLTVTFQTEDGSPIGDPGPDGTLINLIRNIERSIEEGMLTIGHDELIVDEYDLTAETVED